MAFSIQQDSDGQTVRLVGELDLATADRLIEHLAPILPPQGDLRLNLEGLRFMDSSGIRALIQLCQQLGGRGRLVLHSPSGFVARLLEVIRADTFPNWVVEGDGQAH